MVCIYHVQREHSFICHSASPPEREVVTADGLPDVHRVTDRLLKNVRIPSQRFATAAAPDLQRRVQALLEAVAKLVSGKSGQFSGLLGADQHGLAPSVSSDTGTPRPAANLPSVWGAQVPRLTMVLMFCRETPQRLASSVLVIPAFANSTSIFNPSMFIKAPLFLFPDLDTGYRLYLIVSKFGNYVKRFHEKNRKN